MYKITIWDGYIEIVWNIVSYSQGIAIKKARQAHFETYSRQALEVQISKI